MRSILFPFLEGFDWAERSFGFVDIDYGIHAYSVGFWGLNSHMDNIDRNFVDIEGLVKRLMSRSNRVKFGSNCFSV